MGCSDTSDIGEYIRLLPSIHPTIDIFLVHKLRPLIGQPASSALNLSGIHFFRIRHIIVRQSIRIYVKERTISYTYRPSASRNIHSPSTASSRASSYSFAHSYLRRNIS
jgi:hypothetical protein